jgi:hypothetical protein
LTNPTNSQRAGALKSNPEENAEIITMKAEIKEITV